MEECKFKKGDTVEVRDSNGEPWTTRFFLAYHNWSRLNEPFVVFREDGYLESWGQCRYPKPDLKMDDPVWALICKVWGPRHFKGWEGDLMQVWADGKTSHTGSSIFKSGLG